MIEDNQGISTPPQSDADALTAKVRQEAALTKCVRRLVEECLSESGDELVVTPDEREIICQVFKAGQEIKHTRNPGGWLDRLWNWLGQRSAAAFLEDFDAATENSAAVRLQDEIVAFKYRKSGSAGTKRGIKFYSLKRLPLARLAEQLGIADSARVDFKALLDRTSGSFVLGTVDRSQPARGAATYLALSGAAACIDLAEIHNVGSFTRIAESELVVIAVGAADLAELFLKLREAGIAIAEVKPFAAITQALVRAVCRSCSRETVPDKNLVKEIPAFLKPTAPYMVGRGCPTCRNTGYRGMLSLQSAITLDSDAIRAVDGCDNQAQLAEFLTTRGLWPLFVVGIEQVAKGLLTYESLLSAVRGIPDVYMKPLADKIGGKSADAIGMVDFFSGSGTPQPRHGKAALNLNPTDAADSEPLFSRGPTGKLRAKPLVLVVEDDPDQRNILEMVLKSSGYDVASASDGAEGFAAVQREAPDLIISDLMMPVVDGAQFVSRLKADQHFKNIPVLVLTVVADTDREFALLDSGADDYCEKTIQRKILLKRIENLLKRSAR
ncbi:MAG: response regulator [Oligoflexia bacterium]|nr:response regulator [Oligoflexia bacterium]